MIAPPVEVAIRAMNMKLALVLHKILGGGRGFTLGSGVIGYYASPVGPVTVTVRVRVSESVRVKSLGVE